MKFRFIKNHSDFYPVVKMAKALNIRRNRYYRWLGSGERRQLREDEEKKLVEKIKSIQEEVRYSFGTPRITDELQKDGFPVNRKKVARLLGKYSLNRKSKKKFKLTTDSGHNHKVSPNLLNRNFSADAPNAKWVSDITYIWTSEGWLYLCVIIDLYSRKVVGWASSSRIDAQLLLQAFWRAIEARRPPEGLIFHSDRGSQYCSRKFRRALRSLGIRQSMSRKGDCWDNACAESFFKSLKSEWLYDQIFKSRQKANNELFKYIEVFYNRRRTHSTLGYQSPVEYELKNVA